MINIVERSAWTWETSGGGGFSVDVVAMTGGVMKLFNPRHQEEVFHYGGIGAGLSTPGLKVPKLGGAIGRLLAGRALNASGASTELWNTGVIFKTAVVGRRELTRRDFQGACIMADIGVSTPIQGRTGCVFLVGIDPQMLMGFVNPATLPVTLAQVLLRGGNIAPTAAIFSYGDSRGLVAGGNAYIGVLA